MRMASSPFVATSSYHLGSPVALPGSGAWHVGSEEKLEHDREGGRMVHRQPLVVGLYRAGPESPDRDHDQEDHNECQAEAGERVVGPETYHLNRLRRVGSHGAHSAPEYLGPGAQGLLFGWIAGQEVPTWGGIPQCAP